MEIKDKATDRQRGDEANTDKVNYYMKQTGVLDNACGVIACIHAILNNLGPDKIVLEPGKTLTMFNE